MTAVDPRATVHALIEAAPEQSEGRPHLRDRLLSPRQLGDLPPVQPLVEGLLYRNTLVQIAGQPGSYKSFIAVGMACAVALGRTWEGYRVPEAGPVIYVAPEGASGLRTRILAWCESNGVDPAALEGRLFILPEPIQLGKYVDVQEACEVAQEMKALLLVLDTRARCTLGLSENDATEQGTAIHHAEQIQAVAGTTVLGVHHSGRSGSHGRGSNAWDGAVWSDLQLDGSDLRCRIHCEKHKDVPDGCDHHFRMLPHTVSEHLMPKLEAESDEEWLQRRSTLVAVQTSHLDDLAGDRPSDRAVLDIVRTSAGEDGLTTATIVQLSEERNVKRSTAYQAVKSLADKGALRNIGSEKRARYVPTAIAAVLKEET
jgi:hypothetical protein